MPPTTRSHAAALAEADEDPELQEVTSALKQAAARRTRNGRKFSVATPPAITRPLRRSMAPAPESSDASPAKVSIRVNARQPARTKGAIVKQTTAKEKSAGKAQTNPSPTKRGTSSSEAPDKLSGWHPKSIMARGAQLLGFNATHDASDATISGPIDNGPPCRLLRLPAELRNDVYELVVKSGTQPLYIHGSKPKQPPITLTCHQIRAEALPIFYAKNKFECNIPNFDPSEFRQYRRYADRYGLGTVTLHHQLNAPRNVLKANMMAWLKGTFEGEHAALGYSGNQGEEAFNWEKLAHRIVKLFANAKLLKKSKVDWEVAMPLLENMVDSAGVCGEKKKA